MHKQLVFDLQFTKLLDWKDFYVSESNIDAVKWLHGFDKIGTNLLTIYGLAACGKTHLGGLWKKSNMATSITLREQNYSPTEVFLLNNRFIIDDARVLLTNQEWSFHFINKVIESDKKVLILAREHPSYWPFILNDLKSRILTSPAVAIREPDDDLMLKIATKMLKEYGLSIEEKKLIHYLQNIERSHAAILDFVQKLNVAKLSNKVKIKDLFDK